MDKWTKLLVGALLVLAVPYVMATTYPGGGVDTDTHAESDTLGHVTSHFYFAGEMLGAATDQPGADTLEIKPIYVPADGTYISMDFEVTTGNASDARACLYEDEAGVPGALITGTAAIDVTSSGVKENVISETLTRGYYWLGLWTDGTAAFRGANSSGVGGQFIAQTSNSDTGANLGYLHSGTFGACPASAPTSSVTTDGSTPWVLISKS